MTASQPAGYSVPHVEAELGISTRTMQCVNVSFFWHDDLHSAMRKLHLSPSLQDAMLCYMR